MRLIDAETLKNRILELYPIDIGGEAVQKAVIRTVDDAPTIGGWISVEDRQPEDEGDVLVYGVSPRGRKKTAIMNYLAFDADRPRWALDGIWTVLYWMPLPEPPTGDKS